MRLALSATQDSYYINKQPIGHSCDSSTDFITAPEISQLFGEMVALWCIDEWLKSDKLQFNLVELGPGRGTLVYDILRTASKIAPKFFHSIKKIVLLEINPHLKKIQHERLEFFGIKIQHVTNAKDIERSNSIIIANEFFDVLPIKQYKKADVSNWQEIVVKEQNDQLYFDAIYSKIELSDYVNAGVNGIVEVSKASIDSMNDYCQILSKHLGAMLIIDYGYYLNPRERQFDQYLSTLQAVKNHKFHDVLENLGSADLTAHVDFYALKQIVSQFCFQKIKLCTQRDFLKLLGIDLRLQKLVLTNPSNAITLMNQYNYLLGNMGNLFKVLSINNF
jgi:SAM-dependent MidA family methyltransferase